MRTIYCTYKPKEKSPNYIQLIAMFLTALYVAYSIINVLLSTVDIKVKAEVVEVNIENNQMIGFIPERTLNLAIDFNKSDYETKKELIVERLKYNQVSESDINTFVSIFELESCRNTNDPKCFDTRKTPPTIVYHCQRPDGTYKAVEIIRRNGKNVQAYCFDYGWSQTGSEQSIGLAQILVSTWKRYGCDGSIRDYEWQEQVDCAVKIKNVSGFGAWSTYKLLDK